MKTEKRYMKAGMELPNQEKIRTLREKKTFKYLGILAGDPIKHAEMKEKNLTEYLRRRKKILATNIFNGKLMKGIHAWVSPLVKYSGPFLK